MDLPIVLSHQMAWLYYHAPMRGETCAHEAGCGLDGTDIMPAEAGRRIRRFLVACGVPESRLDILDTIFASPHTCSNPVGFRCHVPRKPLSAGELCEIVPGLRVVNPPF